MKPEEIKKCAAALGISEEEFQKQFQPGEMLKAKGIAGLHAHLETMSAHHDAMAKAHGAMSAMHEKMGSHIEKCVKACKGVMGDDEKEAEKALKALVDELKKSDIEDPAAKAAREAAEKAAAAAGNLSKEEVDKMIKAAVEKAVGELPEPPRLRLVPRDGDLNKQRQVAVDSSNPYPV